MKNEEIGIIINNEVYDMSNYESLADLADTEFEGKELSDYTIEELGDVPSRLYNKVDLPCKLDDALETQFVFSEIFDWANYVNKYPGSKGATEAYIDLEYGWNPDRFEDTYIGYYSSEEDYAEEYLDEINYELEENTLENYFDFERYGSDLRDSFEDYTPEALAEYREYLELPPFDEDESLNQGQIFGFIGDDEDSIESEESEDSYNEDDREEVEQEYQEFIDEHSFEIRMAGIEDNEELGRTFIDEVEGGVSHLPSNVIKDYFDIEEFARTLFYDYSFVDGYVFSNY